MNNQLICIVHHLRDMLFSAWSTGHISVHKKTLNLYGKLALSMTAQSNTNKGHIMWSKEHFQHPAKFDGINQNFRCDDLMRMYGEKAGLDHLI